MKYEIVELVDIYLDSKALSWSPTTQRSERHRLVGMAPHLTGKPLDLWRAIEDRKPYTRLTMWTRAVAFWDWCLAYGHKTGGNPYKQFRDENERLFKHVYNPKLPDISFEEAKARIEGIANAAHREKARQLLAGGLRWSESQSLTDGTVLGKGNKRRKVFGIGSARQTASYRGVLASLRRVGLKPHDLRKLFATRLAQEGLGEADLCKVMGWSSFATAKSYIAPMRDAEIDVVVRRINGGTDATKQVSEQISAPS